MPRITQLPPAAAVTGAELIPVVQDGESRNLPASRFATAEQGNAATQAARSVAGLVNWAKRRLSFPDWQPVNQQTGAGWPAFQAGLRDMADLAIVEDELTEAGGDYAGVDDHAGAVVMRDGRVFLCPSKRTTARIYDPKTDTLTVVPGELAGTYAFGGAVLLKDGRVFVVPRSSTTARIYDPETNSYSTPGGNYPGAAAHNGGILLPDGRVFMAPLSATICSVYDPVTNQVTQYPVTGASPNSITSLLMADGRVFLAPLYSQTPRIFDPITNTISTTAAVWPAAAEGGSVTSGAILMADGRIYCTPGYKGTQAIIYDPVSDTLQVAGGIYPFHPNGAPYQGGLLLLNKKLWIAPQTNGTEYRIYNPETDELETYGRLPDYTAPFWGSVLLHDGRVFMVPRKALKAVIYGKPSNLAPLPDNFVLSPFYNKL